MSLVSYSRSLDILAAKHARGSIRHKDQKDRAAVAQIGASFARERLYSPTLLRRQDD